MTNRQQQIRSLQEADFNQIIVLDKDIGGEDRADFFRKRLWQHLRFLRYR